MRNRFVTAVFYDRFPAYYNIRREDNSWLARLENCEGDPASNPPKSILLSKEGRRWIGDAEQSIIDDLGLAIEAQKDQLD